MNEILTTKHRNVELINPTVPIVRKSVAKPIILEDTY